MTNEEIKQKAEKYAETYVSKTAAYIGGAQSMLPKIEELKKQLAEMTRLKNSFAGGVDILDNDNNNLQEELDKLRNPWISVKERLPKKVDGRIRSNALLVTLGQCWTVAEYHFGDKQWRNLLGNNILGDTDVIEPEYWQDVNLPEEVLEKGE